MSFEELRMTEFSIREIVEKINTGEIRIPGFSRKVFLQPDRTAQIIAGLLNSGISNVSTILLKTDEELSFEREIGCFKIPVPANKYSSYFYVIDGLEKMIVVFSTFQKVLTPSKSSNWVDIYYVIGSALSDKQHKFIPVKKNDVTKLHFPLNNFLRSDEYEKAIKGYDETAREELNHIKDLLEKVRFRFRIIEDDNRGRIEV